MPDTSPDPSIVLKITPPKLRKSLLVRERLRAIRNDEVAVFLVEAPAGYGKTSLLSQWRLDWIQSGTAVAWVSLNASDSPSLVTRAIVESVRRARGKELGGRLLDAIGSGETLPALTALLAEVADSACPMVLVFDDCERVNDPAVLEVLDYLLHNLPPTLQIAAGSRSAIPLQTADLLAHGNLRHVTAAALRFDLDETIQLLPQRLGARADADLCARLYEITDGWPLGLQLAAAALERTDDWNRALQAFTASREETTRQLFGSVVVALPPDQAAFITRCALLDALHPALCEAVTGEEDAALWLQQILSETPLLSAVGDSSWMRLHPLAREFLRDRAQEVLPESEQAALHLRAAGWLAARDFGAEAARHALRAGDIDEASRLLINALSTGGFVSGAFDTFAELMVVIPTEEIIRRPLLDVLRNWVFLVKGRMLDAVAGANRLANDPATEVSIRKEALAVLTFGALLADRFDNLQMYASRLPDNEPDSRVARTVATSNAGFAILRGATEQARRHLERNPDNGKYVGGRIMGEVVLGVSYLWEGRPLLAERALRTNHARFEAMGRRHLWVTATAMVLAAACWERDARAEVRALFADRLDIIGVSGVGPEVMCIGYETLARVAASNGEQTRAIQLLEELASLGSARGLLRCQVVSLAERIRLNAAAGRPQRCVTLGAELAALFDSPHPALLPLMPLLRLHWAMAQTYVAFADGDASAATTHLEAAALQAAQLNRGRESVQVLALRALLAERNGESPNALLGEALALAQAGGMVRVFADTLPEVIELIRRWVSSGAITGAAPRTFVDQVLAAAGAPSGSLTPVAIASTAAQLTPKEFEVLKLLAGGLPNKRIAGTLGLSSETVKWHVKKVFTKLNAGSRQHAVDRARMLGLLT